MIKLPWTNSPQRTCSSYSEDREACINPKGSSLRCFAASSEPAMPALVIPHEPSTTVHLCCFDVIVPRNAPVIPKIELEQAGSQVHCQQYWTCQPGSVIWLVHSTLAIDSMLAKL